MVEQLLTGFGADAGSESNFLAKIKDYIGTFLFNTKCPILPKFICSLFKEFRNC